MSWSMNMWGRYFQIHYFCLIHCLAWIFDDCCSPSHLSSLRLTVFECSVPPIKVSTLITFPFAVLTTFIWVIGSSTPPFSLQECMCQCESVCLCICVAQLWIGRSLKDAGAPGSVIIQNLLNKQIWWLTYILVINFMKKIIPKICVKMSRTLCMFILFDLELPQLLESTLGE